MRTNSLYKIFLLFIVMIAGINPVSAHDFEADGIYYNVIGENAPIYLVEVTYRGTSYTSYNKEYTGDIVIPQSVKYNGKTYLVYRIGDSAFRGCNTLTTVTMNTVNHIGSAAFTGCTALTSVSMRSVKSVDDYAFSNCTSLETIEIPKNLTDIGNFMFDGCSKLSSVSMHNNITTIGDYAFRWCSALNSISIPSTVTSIGSHAFKSCTLNPLLIENIDGIQENSLTELNSASVILVPTATDIPTVQLYFNGKIYPYDACYAIENCASYLGGIEFTLWENTYDTKETIITDVIVAESPIAANENDVYFVDGLVPDSVYDILVCYQYESIVLTKDSNIYIAPTDIETRAIQTSIVKDTIHAQIKTLLPEIFTQYVNRTFRTYTTLISADKDLTVSPSEKGVYVMGFKQSGSNIDDGKKYTANSNNTIRISGLIPGENYILNSYAIYNGKEILGRGEDITLGTPELEVKKLSITQTMYSAQIIASEEEGLIPIYLGLYIKEKDSDEEWIKYVADSTGTVRIKGLIPEKSYTIRPYAIYTFEKDYEYQGVDYTFNTETITCSLISTITQTTISLSLKANVDEELSVSEMGIYYAGDKYKASNGAVTLKGLIPNTSYTVYPYVVYNGEEYKKSTDKKTYTTKDISVGFNSLSNAITATTATVSAWYNLGDATLEECGFKSYESDGNILRLSGLNPDTKYGVTYYVKTKEGREKTATTTFTTSSLTLTTLKAKATSNTKAVICAETNIVNEETGTGFEWRRIDAPDLVPSEEVYCAVHEGVMEGVLNNLSASTYYKYRPFYKSEAGNMYYGDWIGFGTADAYVYFTPTVHTYATATVEHNTATLNGYALAGSDDIVEQGFEYWSEGVSTRATDGVQTVTATGQRMSVTLNDLQYNTVYKYRAYVKTATETTYGEEQTFTTGEDPAGISEVSVTEMLIEIRTIAGNIEIRLTNGNEPVRYALYTLNGVQIANGETEVSDTWQRLHTQRLTPGLYLVRVKDRAIKVLVR